MICFIGLSRSYWFIQSTRSRCCLFLVVAAALAQEFRGTILGRVTDSSGGVIANAAVTITNAGTNTAVKTTTTAAGAYTVPFLIPGSYTVAVQAAGFRTFQRQGVVVQVQDRVEISVVLEPGVVTENVVVRGETSLLQPHRAPSARWSTRPASSISP